MKSLFIPSLLLSAIAASPLGGAAQQPSAPVSPTASACPIAASEAYLSSLPQPPSTDPAQPPQSMLNLHVTALDNDAKSIRSYTVHARITTTPGGSFEKLPNSAVLTRAGHDPLQPGTPRQLDWRFPAGRFTTRLQSIWFDKVVFADGTTWTRTPGDSCSFRATGHIVQTTRQP